MNWTCPVGGLAPVYPTYDWSLVRWQSLITLLPPTNYLDNKMITVIMTIISDEPIGVFS